jgi:hypothetical protein
MERVVKEGTKREGSFARAEVTAMLELCGAQPNGTPESRFNPHAEQLFRLTHFLPSASVFVPQFARP